MPILVDSGPSLAEFGPISRAKVSFKLGQHLIDCNPTSAEAAQVSWHPGRNWVRNMIQLGRSLYIHVALYNMKLSSIELYDCNTVYVSIHIYKCNCDSNNIYSYNDVCIIFIYPCLPVYLSVCLFVHIFTLTYIVAELYRCIQRDQQTHTWISKTLRPHSNTGIHTYMHIYKSKLSIHINVTINLHI